MVTGWIQLNGTWYYLSTSGAMATGWYVVNGKWYYSDASGAMQLGWIQLNGKWYYLKTTSPDSGSMLTGWRDIGGSKYYLDSNGVMSTYAVAAYKNNTYSGTADGQAFISQLANTKYGKISRYFPASSVKKSNFYSTGEYIKYWASHGLTEGTIYGDANSVKFNVKSQSLKWSGNNLEFVFLAACSQLSSGLINKYSDAMKGNKGVRVVAGYHKSAPSGKTGHDRKVVDSFMRFAKTGESVKSSWIKANEEQGVGMNCTVLAHTGNAQYSRFSGFPGQTYSRPNDNNIAKYDVSFRGVSTLNETTIGGIDFKADVADLADLEIPEYQLQKSDKVYTINEAIDTMVFEEESQTITTSGEIGDEEILYNEDEAVTKVQDWVENAVDEFNSNQLETPSVKEIVKSEITDEYNEGENQNTVAYIVEFDNKVDGISIQDEGINAIIDNSGVKYTSIKWNDYEKVSQKTRVISNKVDFEKATDILSEEILSNGETRSLLSDSESGDRTTVLNAELVFAFEEENNVYVPVWRYEMEDGKIYNVTCDTGEVTEI